VGGDVKRVLLVDDDDDLREALCDILTFGGYEVVGVGNGDEALAWLQGHRPDLILLDLMMPGMSGVEFMERLDGARDIPVLVFSGDTHVAEQAAAIGADGALRKPASMEKLLEEVARYA
jgi:CheY-like chemotaxis protein